MTMMSFPLTVDDRIDELTATRSLLRERLAGKPQPGTSRLRRDSVLVRDLALDSARTSAQASLVPMRSAPYPVTRFPNPGLRAPHSAGARPKGMGARYSQSAVALLLYR